MKGLIYGDFTLNKKWFIMAGIIAAIGAAVGGVLVNVLDDSPDAVTLIDNTLFLFEIFPLVLCIEWLGRNLERHIKSRFADYALSAPVSKGKFVLTELTQNALSLVIGFAMCLALRGIVCIFDGSYWSVDHLKMLAGLVLFMFVFDTALIPLVIKLKSDEKAGMVIGLITGFGIVFPLVTWFKVTHKEDTMGQLLKIITELINKAWFFPAYIGVCAALSAVFCAVTYHMLKKGDVC